MQQSSVVHKQIPSNHHASPFAGLLNSFQTTHFCDTRKMTPPFFGNAVIYANLHPSQSEVGVLNLPSERDCKLGSLFRPAIKTKLVKDCLCSGNISCRGNTGLDCSPVSCSHASAEQATLHRHVPHWHSWGSPACSLRL